MERSIGEHIFFHILLDMYMNIYCIGSGFYIQTCASMYDNDIEHIYKHKLHNQEQGIRFRTSIEACEIFLHHFAHVKA